MTEWVEQWICIKFCILAWTFLCGNYSGDSDGCSHGQRVIGSYIMTMRLLMHHILCRTFLSKHQMTQVTQPPYSPGLMPCDFWLFLKLKLPLKGKTFQMVDEIQENTMGQLMAVGRTVWGPNVPTLKGTEVSLSCVQCFLYLVSYSINVSTFHIIWLVLTGQTLYIPPIVLILVSPVSKKHN